MSIIAQAYVWQHASKLSNRALIVGLAIADCHNPDTGQCNPKLDVIAEKIGRTTKTVKRGIAELREQSVITTKRRNRTGSNHYCFPDCKEFTKGQRVSPPKGQRVSPPKGQRVSPRERYPCVPSETKEETKEETEQEVFQTHDAFGLCDGQTPKTPVSGIKGESLVENFKAKCKTYPDARLRFYMDCGRLHSDADHFHRPKSHAKPLTFGQLDGLRVWFTNFPESGCAVMNHAMANWSQLRVKHRIANTTPTISALTKIDPKTLLDSWKRSQYDAMLRRVENLQTLAQENAA